LYIFKKIIFSDLIARWLKGKLKATPRNSFSGLLDVASGLWPKPGLATGSTLEDQTAVARERLSFGAPRLQNAPALNWCGAEDRCNFPLLWQSDKAPRNKQTILARIK
jgi:hypothetical protein